MTLVYSSLKILYLLRDNDIDQNTFAFRNSIIFLILRLY